MTDTVPFDPNNPEHLAGFERTINKIAAQIPKDAPMYLVISREDWKFIRGSKATS